MSVAELWAAAVARAPAKPCVTYYDDASGERTELSWKSFDNWVAKTANLLRDGAGVEPGDTVAVLLPLHWQALVLVIASWLVGADVQQDVAGADVAAVAEDRLAEIADHRSSLRDVIALSLRPLAAPLVRQVPGVTDYASEVPGYGDRFDSPGEAPAGALAALELAGDGVAADDRLLLPAGDPVAAAALLVQPGASLVLCPFTQAYDLAPTAKDERATIVTYHPPSGS